MLVTLIPFIHLKDCTVALLKKLSQFDIDEFILQHHMPIIASLLLVIMYLLSLLMEYDLFSFIQNNLYYRNRRLQRKIDSLNEENSTLLYKLNLLREKEARSEEAQSEEAQSGEAQSGEIERMAEEATREEVEAQSADAEAQSADAEATKEEAQSAAEPAKAKVKIPYKKLADQVRAVIEDNPDKVTPALYQLALLTGVWTERRTRYGKTQSASEAQSAK